jgi:serine/threonine-protein kinase RsbW
MTTRVFPANIGEFDHVMAFFRDEINRLHLINKAAKQFEVAVEEAVVNIIHHAYKTPAGLLEMTISFNEQSGCVDVCLKDQGIGFNPLEKPEIKTPNGDINAQEIGGLGVHFIKNMVDYIHYEHIEENNILTLSKKLTSVQES